MNFSQLRAEETAPETDTDTHDEDEEMSSDEEEDERVAERRQNRYEILLKYLVRTKSAEELATIHEKLQ